MAVVDADMLFTYISCKFSGSSNDSYVFQTSGLYNFLEEGGIGFLLGDSVYPLSKSLMTPYLETEDITVEKLSFNRAHRATRNIIERAFGILKSRFRCIDKTGE